MLAIPAFWLQCCLRSYRNVWLVICNWRRLSSHPDHELQSVRMSNGSMQDTTQLDSAVCTTTRLPWVSLIILTKPDTSSSFKVFMFVKLVSSNYTYPDGGCILFTDARIYPAGELLWGSGDGMLRLKSTGSCFFTALFINGDLFGHWV